MTDEERLIADVRERLTPLIGEFPAAATALLVATVLPRDCVPWEWLRELMIARHPEVAEHPPLWEGLRHRLVASGLLTPGPSPEVARIEPRVADELASALTERETASLGEQLRGVVSARLARFQAERQRLFQDVVRGNAGEAAQAGWYVAPVEEVQDRAAELGNVKVRPEGDGSFVLSLKKDAFWEGPCFEAFVREQFLSDDLDAIEWALRTHEVPSREIGDARTRMEALPARKPEGLQEARVLGLYWLNAADDQSRRGAQQSAWHTAVRACELFEKLHEQHPEDQDVAALLEQAVHARWVHDW
jgi:hypothetical protein